MQPAPIFNIQHLHIHPGTLVSTAFGEPIAGSVEDTAAKASRFSLSADGLIVTDHKTDLQWAAKESATRMDFEAAEKHCAALRLGGFNDWRLPDLEELESIRDLTRYAPCIDTAFFTSNNDWVWSRTPCAWSSDLAWIVDFGSGGVGDGGRLGGAFVRAVRRVSPAGQ
jgi:hypothetical protein